MMIIYLICLHTVTPGDVLSIILCTTSHDEPTYLYMYSIRTRLLSERTFLAAVLETDRYYIYRYLHLYVKRICK